jgi:hypothetical protein
MKRFNLALVIFILVVILTGCASADPEPSREFFSNFTIGEIIAENEAYLLESSRILSGGSVGPPEPFVQRNEEISVQIEADNIPSFMQAVKSDIEKAVTDNGAQLQGYGTGSIESLEYFSLAYSQDESYGTIHVWGVPGEGTEFKIIVLLTED